MGQRHGICGIRKICACTVGLKKHACGHRRSPILHGDAKDTKTNAAVSQMRRDRKSVRASTDNSDFTIRHSSLRLECQSIGSQQVYQTTRKEVWLLLTNSKLDGKKRVGLDSKCPFDGAMTNSKHQSSRLYSVRAGESRAKRFNARTRNGWKKVRLPT